MLRSRIGLLTLGQRAQTVARKALWSGPRSNFRCKENWTL